jgi:hypothetical protein
MQPVSMTTRRYIPEDGNLHNYRSENLRPCNKMYYLYISLRVMFGSETSLTTSEDEIGTKTKCEGKCQEEDHVHAGASKFALTHDVSLCACGLSDKLHRNSVDCSYIALTRVGTGVPRVILSWVTALIQFCFV